MAETSPTTPPEAPHLQPRLNLLQATALNMCNMVGVGPFITIPLLMTALGGPQALLGWIVALLIVIPDGMVWSELGAALPGSGGSYVYLREGFGRQTWGRLIAFLFIWQVIISGPLEIASGYIGFAKYAAYLWKGLDAWGMAFLAAGLGVLNVVLLYRRITSIARITMALWIGMLLTTGAVVLSGLFHFQPRVAFDFPPGAFRFSNGFLFGLGAAARVGVYDYLGYYDVCYIGDEVQNPGRVIPRSVLLSVLGVAVLYFGINLSVIGVIPWREFVPNDAHPESNFIVSIFMERLYGSGVARVFTLMVLWTTVGSVFALLLGYSRIPFAAAKNGDFFAPFARLHPAGFPSISLLVIGGLSIACSFISLDVVIDALVTTRIVVQFIGQIAAVSLLRKNQPDMPRPYRMWLYPLPCLVALVGWLFLFLTSQPRTILFGLGLVAIGAVFFIVRAIRTNTWPFGEMPAKHAK